MALTGGPWLIYDHYLSVQPWNQDFDPDEEKITKIAAWIRISKLPLDYYDKGILYVLGSQVGRVLKVNMNTLRRTKGHFARLCVELDLNEPLRPLILINGKERRIQYESIHLVCLECGRYGHDVDHCTHTVERKSGTGGKDGLQGRSKNGLEAETGMGKDTSERGARCHREEAASEVETRALYDD
ncbi:uncharacterized protein LOC114713055 [Neltuma alba]|uniref:uncharacterized protein LOC114713055 n=1 Tax=Neltuma alba TaxID=207710 RepID=UPI0010A2CCCA|nr:uncharacterized protein LOC114713055 [Prosopis alba]